MSRPVAFQQTVTFGGEQRQVTRQRLYRFDDGDFDARMYNDAAAAGNQPSRRRRRNKSSASAADEDSDEDPYAEAQYTALDESPEIIDRFRNDVSSARFQNMVQARAVAQPLSTRPRTSEEVRKQRQAQILAAMADAADAEHSLFSIDYARCVPKAYLREFLASVEVSNVCAALVPALFVRDERYRYHLEEEHWMRALADAGGVFKSAETLVLDGHMRTLTPLPPAESGWYTRLRVESEHAHCVDDKTHMRVLTFQIQTLAAATAVDDGTLLEARRDSDMGYYVRVVAHLVDGDEQAEAARNVLCFRSFHFSRHA